MFKQLQYVTIYLLILLLSSACATTNPANEIRMYGEQQPTKDMQAANEMYIEKMKELHGNVETASQEVAKIAWSYYYRGDHKTAMKRFNQVWLLNSNNADAYWGFGLLAYNDMKYSECITLLEKAYSLDHTNARLTADLAYHHAEEARSFMLTRNKKDEQILNMSNSLFEKASKLEPEYGFLYGQWAVVLYYQGKYKEAWEKVYIARRLKEEGRPNIDWRFLKDLKSIMPDPYR